MTPKMWPPTMRFTRAGGTQIGSLVTRQRMRVYSALLLRPTSRPLSRCWRQRTASSMRRGGHGHDFANVYAVQVASQRAGL